MPLAATQKVPSKAPPASRPASIRSTGPSAAPGHTLPPIARCACGGGCPRCRGAGLSLSLPGDPLEREAERIADQVVAAPAQFDGGGVEFHSGHRTARPPSSAWPAFAAQVAADSGKPLDANLRSEMERRFGHDFSHVRVHTGAQAGQAAEDFGARAFTMGSDIVFGAGRFAAGTQAGRRLLAHELAHVVQQQRYAPASVGVQRDQDPALPQPPRGTGAYAAWFGESLVAIDVGADWPSEEVRSRFINEYLAYARSHPRRKELYAQAAKDYPQAAELERRLRRHGEAFGTRKRIRVIEVLVPETKFGSPVGSFGSRMFSQAEPVAQYETEIDQPDPSAGFNFDTYIMNLSTGQRIAAKHLGGERFRVFMGSEKCPGCHFGHGLEVEFHGESFVLALAPQILGAASVMGRMAPRRLPPPRVTDADVVATNARNPASIRPQNPQSHQQDWQGRGGVGKAPTAYRDADGAVRVSTDSWLFKPATRAGIPPVSPTGSAPTPQPAANRHAIRLSSAFSPLIRMIIVGGFIVTLVFGGLEALDGALAVGSYSVLVFMTQRLLWPLTSLGEVADLYQRAMASTHRVMDLLDTPITIRSGPRHLDPASVRGHLALRDVHFAYDGRPPVFAGLSLDLHPEQTVAFVGPTGAGKSTLVKLLLRMYEPQRGQITLDGVPIGELALGDLRRAIGFVSQDVFLFHGTIADNIAYGSFGASREAIAEAARVAEAHDFIAALPQGYDTVIGEWGQRLSGGQRQRLSIARAVLKDPPVLILDEATSSVDNETEAAIQRSLERLAVGRVTLIIAHRLSTVRHAHRIVVLGAGGVQEEGTHDALVAQGGVYAALWAVQTGAREPLSARR